MTSHCIALHCIASHRIASHRIAFRRQVCECWASGANDGGVALAWAPVLAQRFDNVPMALLTLFEVATTEG